MCDKAMVETEMEPIMYDHLSLFDAIREGNVRATLSLLKKDPSLLFERMSQDLDDMEEEDFKGTTKRRTPVFFCVSQGRTGLLQAWAEQPEIKGDLVRAVSKADEFTFLPLHYACNFGRLEMVRFLHGMLQ
jgi:hypothetical protein